LKNNWIKIVLVISLDGKIANPNDQKIHLGGIGDRQVLEESLAWADATLMGGETLRIHKNTCLIHQKKLIQRRLLEKKPEQPISLIVSNTNNHTLDFPFFQQPINRWLISSIKSLEEKNLSKGYDRLIHCKPKWAETLSEISKIGLKNIVVLGGSKLIGSLLKEDQIDELQLTLTPKILGGEYSWIPNNLNDLPKHFSRSNSWVLQETKIVGNNEIMLRYYKNN
tara:strand:- start:643 stop:1314 length:672 start_codon:yes stop_codon:yes gene_type:complete